MDEYGRNRERSSRRSQADGPFSNRGSSDGRQRRPASGSAYDASRASSNQRHTQRAARPAPSRTRTSSTSTRSAAASSRRAVSGQSRREGSAKYRGGAASRRVGTASRSAKSTSRNAGMASGVTGLLNRLPSIRFIVLAVVALVLVILVGFALSWCGGHEAPTPQASSASEAAQSSAAADAASSSATSTSQDSASASGSAAASSAAATSSSTVGVSASRGVVNAKQGDVSYPVAQAAKLKYRDADFAVDPSRTTWNRDHTNGRKTIYLTFDDGPSENTERVLDVLDAYGCKATFFVTGQNPDYFSWIKETYDRGHTIGLHSMTHDYASCYSSPESFWNEFDAIGQVVKDQIGYVPCFIRFPGGTSNTISADYSQGIMTYLVQDVQNRGYQYYDWETSCGDGAVHTADELVEAGCQPLESDNVIYLAHDGTAKGSTAEALPSIIEYYQAQGYTFEAIDRDTLLYQHGVSN